MEASKLRAFVKYFEIVPSSINVVFRVVSMVFPVSFDRSVFKIPLDGVIS